MIDSILYNVYRLLLLGEAERLGIIDKEKYKNILTKLLNVYQTENEGSDKDEMS